MKMLTAFVLSLVAALLQCSIANAEMVPVPTVPPLAASPLLITSYQASNDGLDLVQLYNTDDTLLSLSGMTLKYSLADGTVRQIPLDGYMEPGRHMLIAADDVLVGSELVAFRFAPISIMPVTIWVESAQFANVTLPTAALVDGFYKRNHTSSGAYSTAATFTTAFAKSTSNEIEADKLYTPPALPQVNIVEIYPYASDCAPNDPSTLCGDYIKMHNPMSGTVYLDDFVLRTDSSSASRTSSNTFSLDGIALKADEYRTIWLTDDEERISLTNSGGYVWLEDAWDLAGYDDMTMIRYESAGSTLQGQSWALIGGVWRWTNQPNPVGENKVSLVMPGMGGGVNTLSECLAGKYRNPETNRCRSIEEAVNALAACEEGKERNPATNRCRSVATASASLTPCDEGQERNPATNRCRSVLGASASLQPCGEGQQRNPATNRCRNVPGTLAETAFPVESVASTQGEKIGWLAFAFVGALAAGYALWEWRSEIGAGLGRLKHAILRT